MKKYAEQFIKSGLLAFLILTISTFSNSVYSQNSDAYQLQAMLNSGLPANSADTFGISVDVDGDTAIVGAQSQKVGQNGGQGAAYIYVRNGSTWSLQQMLTASDGQERDAFGAEVALEGDTAFVTSYTANTVGKGDGKIYVFKRTGTTWTQTQTLVPNDPITGAGEAFGSALAIDNGTLVAGAFNKSVNNAPYGAAYIFTGSGGTWTQQAKLFDPTSTVNDKFGFSVDISGNSVIVGTPGQNGLGAEDGRGFAYIFTGSGSSWTQQQKIISSDRAAGDSFGIDVAIDGDTAAVGASEKDSLKGGVYIFTRSGGSWTQRTKINHPLTSQLNRFGLSVDLEGRILAVTVPRLETQPNPTRGVIVYSGSGATWNQIDFLETSGSYCVDIDNNTIISGQQSSGSSSNGEAFIHATSGTASNQIKLVAGDVSANRNFGRRVAISDKFALTGGSGGVNLFVRNGMSWSFSKKVTSSFAEDSSTLLQGGLAISDNFMVVGSSSAKVGGVSSAGAVYTFRLINGEFVDEQRIVSPDGATANEFFGEILAATDNTLVLGNPTHKENSNDAQGAVYVFVRNGNAWQFQQKLTASDGKALDRFGTDVDISEDTIVVGTGVPLKGKAYIFTRSNGTWTERQIISASDGTNSDYFGRTVAIQKDTIAVGAVRSVNTGSRFLNGAVYVVTRTGNTFTEQQKIFVENNDNINTFGKSIAVSNDKIIIGANTLNPFKGIVYVYQSNGSTWRRIGRLDAADNNGNDNFGDSLDASGNTVIVGSPNASINGIMNVGAAYVFDVENDLIKTSGIIDFDFDGDGKSDLGIFRPAEGNWYLNNSTSGFSAIKFGVNTDQLTPADFDGDGKTDIAVWREGANGRFYILQSSDNAARLENFGIAGDKPIVGDWDGDGKADPGVYREGAQSVFYYLGSLNNPNKNITFLPFGTTGDKPVRGDFDGDGKLDLAVFRPSSGTFYIRSSSDGSVRYVNFGLATDKMVLADYDGDSKTDIAIYRSGAWFILQSSNNQIRYETFGSATDAPVPADYDGDGKTDAAIYRSGIWYIKSSLNGSVSIRNFGLADDKAIPNAFVR